jgi:hypothetical protein
MLVGQIGKILVVIENEDTELFEDSSYDETISSSKIVNSDIHTFIAFAIFRINLRDIVVENSKVSLLVKSYASQVKVIENIVLRESTIREKVLEVRD